MTLPAQKPLKIHLCGIGGIGMTALAGLLRAQGYQVTGSDENLYPPTDTILKKLGTRVHTPYDPGNIAQDIDLCVIGNALSANHPEVIALKERGLPYKSMPETLGDFFMAGKKPLVVTGTHGKTTTTSLIGHLLIELGLDPTVFVGGMAKNLQGPFRRGEGDFVVAEGDEYDSAFFDKRPKFMHYHPHRLLITSLEFDHADIYKDLAAIEAAFVTLIQSLAASSQIIACVDSPSVQKMMHHCHGRILSYGRAEGADFQLSEVKPLPAEHSRTHSRVSIRLPDRSSLSFAWPMLGEHNALNATGALALLTSLDIAPTEKKILQALNTFGGVAKRQEVKCVVGDILVMADFAHHPTAIAQTLKAVKTHYPERRLWAIFEPRSNTSMRNVHQDAFSECFQGADRIIIAPLGRPEKVPPSERLDVAAVVKQLQEKGSMAATYPNVDTIVASLAATLKCGDLILVMSNGHFGGLIDKLADLLQQRSQR